MDKKLEKAINDQIKNEFYSSYLYLAMAAYCELRNLPGFAHWMKVQAKEEWGHGMKFFDFLNDVGAKVVLQTIDQPPAEFGSMTEMFEKVLGHEKKVTAMINALYELSQKVVDNASLVMLQWFINEQVEEEKNATLIVETLKTMKADAGTALIMMDRQLAKRE